MSKPYPALCKDCLWSRPEEHSVWNLKCHNPKVNAEDEWALSAASSFPEGVGSTCHTERARVWFGKCGRKGKLWWKRA